MNPSPTQPLCTHKQSRKIESMRTQKEPPKLLPHVTNEFVSPHCHCHLINSQGKQSRCLHRNRPQSAFSGDEWIRQPPQPLLTHKESRKTESLPTKKKTLKLLSQVTNGFVSPHSPCVLINTQGKLSRCPLRNSPQNCFHNLRMDSSAHTAPVDS